MTTNDKVGLVVLDDECCPAVLSSPLSEGQAVTLARDFAVLADPVRLRLLSMLASAPTGEACVCELVEPLDRSQPTVSHHLKILSEAGLDRRREAGPLGLVPGRARPPGPVARRAGLRRPRFRICVKFVSSSGRNVPTSPTGVTYMIKRRFDVWLALCVLLGVVLVLLAGFHRLGVDLELPPPFGP